MKARTAKEAWNIANEIFPTDYIKNDEKSARAGYDIYTSTLDGCTAWISDLSNRLEINLENGKTINIWIEAETVAEGSKKPAESAELLRGIESTVTLESVTTHKTTDEETTTRKEIYLTLSAETTLKDIAHFERGARLLIKRARSASNKGDHVTVTLTKARYIRTAWGDLLQTRFEMWEGHGDYITSDGVHLTPSEIYNDNLVHDMWVTGANGEILDEITI